MSEKTYRKGDEMTVEKLIKRLQQYQKNHPGVNVYVIDSQGDDTEIDDIFYCDFNNYDGKKAIIISNGNGFRNYGY